MERRLRLFEFGRVGMLATWHPRPGPSAYPRGTRPANPPRRRDARDRAAEAAELRATGRSLLDDGAADDVRQQQLLLAEQQHAYSRRADLPRTNRGGAAAATRIFRGDGRARRYKRGDLETVRRIQRKLDAIGRDDGQKEFRPAGWG